MTLSSLSYLGNVLFFLASIGAFFAGKSKGAEEAQANANTAQAQTIQAQRERIDILEKQNQEQQSLIDTLKVRIDYLEELVIYGNPKLVQPGALPVVPGGRRKNPSGNAAGSGHGSV